jgi:hypothetical protein
MISKKEEMINENKRMIVKKEEKIIQNKNIIFKKEEKITENKRMIIQKENQIDKLNGQVGTLADILQTVLPEMNLIPDKINKLSSSNSIVPGSKQIVYFIEEWLEFEENMEAFVKESISKNHVRKYPKKNIEKMFELESHDEYKYLINNICNTIFSNCLFENVKFSMETKISSIFKEKVTKVSVDICCLTKLDSETLAIIEIKTIKNFSFEKNKKVLNSKELIDEFSKGKSKNFRDYIEQLYSYMILKNTKYGMLSIYKYTIFVQIVDRDNKPILCISNPIKFDSFIKATFYIISKSTDNNKIIEGNILDYMKIFDQSNENPKTLSPEASININNCTTISDNLKKSQSISSNTDNDSAYSSSNNLELNIQHELECAFFYFLDVIGSGRTGDILKLKIDLNDNFIAFKFIDIYTGKKDIKKELQNEIEVYKWLQKKKVECIPKLVFDGVVFIFLSLVTEVVDGKIIVFDEMNVLQKKSCINSLKILHSNGVLHRDIRSSNFIIQENNQCIIIDFGFSKIFEKINEEAKELFANELAELNQLLYN